MKIFHLEVCFILLSYTSTSRAQSLRADVSLSGDLDGPGRHGQTCHLPDVINVVITAADVTIPLRASKSSRVTQDAPVFFIGDDGEVRPSTAVDRETYALYHDLNNGAAILVTCPLAGKRKSTMEGTVTYKGRQYHLRHSSRRRRDVSSVTSESDEYQLTEVAEDPVKGQTIDYVSTGVKNLNSDPSPSVGDETHEDTSLHHRVRRATAGQNVYIDITLVIAFDIYQTYYEDSEEVTETRKQADALERLKRHFALLMSEVDMHFRMIGTRLPYNISIGLASFGIAKSAAASKWTEERKQLSNLSDRYVVDSEATLKAFATWIANSRTLPAMDYYILFTGYDFFDQSSGTSVSGAAYLGGVCASTERVTARPGRNSAVVEDKEHCFSTTVSVTVHEIGHGLGADHDGESNYCLALDAYVMTPVKPKDNEINYGIFSACSLAYFKSTFARLSTSTKSESCLHEIISPAGVPKVTGLVPGQVYDVQTQCKRAFGNESSVCSSLTPIGDNMCSKTYCHNPKMPGYCSSIPLFRGTTCGNKKWCVNAFCVSSPEAGNMDESCPFGDRSTRPHSYSFKTCAEFASEKPSMCYDGHFWNSCCKTCNDVRRDNSGMCPFGDQHIRPHTYSYKTCAEYVSEESSKCYDDDFRYSCCKTCHDFSRDNPGVCPFGDRRTQPHSFSYKTCAEYVSEEPSQCYDDDFRYSCCKTCHDVSRDNPVTCPFGDRETAPSSDSNKTCAEYASEEPRRCYDDDFRYSCCKTCNDVRRDKPGCPYGDSRALCEPSSCNNVHPWQTCCETCSAFLAASSTTPTLTFCPEIQAVQLTMSMLPNLVSVSSWLLGNSVSLE